MKRFPIITLMMIILVSACNMQTKTDSKAAEDSSDKKVFQLVEQWRTDTILKIPESVYYDKDGGVLYVTNIASTNEPEGKGFISKVDLHGNIIDLEWLTGITFPKGMAMVGDKLYVTELNSVVEIDIPNAEIIRRIKIDSATFLNDLTSDESGNLFVTDSRGSAVYKIAGGEVSLVLNAGLQGPNGLHAEDNGLLIAANGKLSFLSDFEVDGTLSFLADSISRGDGIADTGIPGHYLVSSWSGEVFMVYPDNSKASLLYTADKEIQTADIDYAIDLELLFVPTFFGNNVVAYKLVAE